MSSVKSIDAGGTSGDGRTGGHLNSVFTLILYLTSPLPEQRSMVFEQIQSEQLGKFDQYQLDKQIHPIGKG